MTELSKERCLEIARDMTAWIDKNAFDAETAFQSIGLSKEEVVLLRAEVDRRDSAIKKDCRAKLQALLGE